MVGSDLILMTLSMGWPNCLNNMWRFKPLYVVLVYHCGSDQGWSDIFSFTALNDSSHFSPRFALYGDLGNENPQSLARLQKETQLGMYDAILHIGKLHSDKCTAAFYTVKAV